jgi:hypothetical protein
VGGDCRVDCSGPNTGCTIVANNDDGTPVQFFYCYSFTTPVGKSDCGPTKGPPAFQLIKCLKSCTASKDPAVLLTQFVDVYISQDVATGFAATSGTIYTIDP